MSENSKTRLFIFACMLILPVVIALAGSKNIAERNDRYVRNYQDLSIDGSDFSPIVNLASDILHEAGAGLEDMLYEAGLLAVSLVSMLLFKLLKLKKDSDFSKKELYGYAFILAAVTLISITADLVCTEFLSVDTVIIFNATYFIFASVFVLLYVWKFLRRTENV